MAHFPKIRRLKDRCGHKVFLEPYGTKGQGRFLYAIICRDPIEDEKEDIVLDRKGVKKLIRKLTKMLKDARG